MRVTIEIVEPPRLNPREGKLLDFHSAINALSAISTEIHLLADESPSAETVLMPYTEAIQRICGRLDDFTDPETFLREALGFLQNLEQSLDRVAQSQKQSHRNLESLRAILAVTRVRVGELSARQSDGNGWKRTSIDELVTAFTAVFAAIEKHARGRFRITYEAEQQGANDYLIDLRFESRQSGHLFIPPEFPDVLRDLAANARKYTEPGGTISLHVRQEADRIHCSITDTGRGIPSDEIVAVCDFGVRGSNIGEIRSLGGGFGLTKAVSLVKSWKGRFWISSEVGQGTEVSFEIPLPESFHDSASIPSLERDEDSLQTPR